jgi:hypothetical protein
MCLFLIFGNEISGPTIVLFTKVASSVTDSCEGMPFLTLSHCHTVAAAVEPLALVAAVASSTVEVRASWRVIGD